MVESTTKFMKLMTLYNEFKAFVGSLPVVNDDAERNVKLLKGYKCGRQIENFRQDLLFVIQLKRKTFVIKIKKNHTHAWVASTRISSLNYALSSTYMHCRILYLMHVFACLLSSSLLGFFLAAHSTFNIST